MTYDANGNLISDGWGDFEISYNILNLPCSISSNQDMFRSTYGANAHANDNKPKALTYAISEKETGIYGYSPNGEIVEMSGIFLHRNNWDGGASNASRGCLTIDGRSWRKVEKQLGKSKKITIFVTR